MKISLVVNIHPTDIHQQDEAEFETTRRENEKKSWLTTKTLTEKNEVSNMISVL